MPAIANGTIVKLDEEKRLVFGWASIIKDVYGKVLLDRQEDFIDSEDELEKSAYDYVLKSRDGGEMHIRKGVSTMIESVVLSEEKQKALGIPAGVVPIGWWVGFKVTDSRVWGEVKKGGYIGFSVHGTGKRNPTEIALADITELEKGCDCEGAELSDSVSTTPQFDSKYWEIMRKSVEFNTKSAIEKSKKKKPKNKVATVMREFNAGKLKSFQGGKVKSRKQALAIALSEQRRQKMKKDDSKVADILKVLLADSVSVYHEAHGFHWNVKGQDFSQYHSLFEQIYTDIYGSIDAIAENILKMGNDAPFQLSQFVTMRSIPETNPADNPMAMAKELLDALGSLIETLNDAFTIATEENQQGVANFIAERIDSTQKWMWQLRVSLVVQKGDTPGHDFRGNQWTRGRGAGANASKKKA